MRKHLKKSQDKTVSPSEFLKTSENPQETLNIGHYLSFKLFLGAVVLIFLSHLISLWSVLGNLPDTLVSLVIWNIGAVIVLILLILGESRLRSDRLPLFSREESVWEATDTEESSITDDLDTTNPQSSTK